jgi:DNA-binding MurR/RpiR family transcriptional regulator
VVRFARALGFEGFPEMQGAARDEYRRIREAGGDSAIRPSRRDTYCVLWNE